MLEVLLELVYFRKRRQ